MVRTAIVVTALFLGTAAHAQDRPVGLKDYYLGMSIEEAKALPVASPEGDITELLCSGDDGASKALDPSPDEAAAGIVTCWPHRGKRLSDIAISDSIIATAMLMFHDNRLYQIAASFNMDDSKTVANALTMRFGEPSSRESRTVKNLLGAEIEGAVIHWTIGANDIAYIAPSRKIDEFAVTYSDVPTFAAVTKMREEYAAAHSGI